MDNAANCDSLACILPIYLPKFQGMASCTHCFAHIINLVAKSFIAFFFQKPRKKVVEIAGDAVQPIIEEDDNTDLDNDKAISEEADASSDATSNDDRREMHNNAVIKTFEGKTILIMEQEDIIIEESECRIALGIFPRISGLACRVHNITTLKEKFNKLIEDDEEFSGNTRTLAQQVPTRWNSDLDCLSAHIYFRPIIEQLTSNSNNNLSGFRLSEEQWKLAQQVEEVLLVSENSNKFYFINFVVLVISKICKVLHISKAQKKNHNNDTNAANVIHVGAQAALLVLDKYSVFTSDCEVYQVAMGILLH
ncbi:hypothetical protein BDQ17DRAFT_1260053 [Cyathus striatus]|nr:hypothetical protein BDQ17DRAFT_1260053 [Cyathus striatus]